MISHKTRWAPLVAAVAALGLMACGSDDSKSSGDDDPSGGGAGGSTGDAEVELEIFSWWTSGGEQEALEELVAVHETNHPNATVVNRAIEYADEARSQLQDRMAQGNPPDSFQANIGVDLLQWVGDTEADTLLDPLNNLATENEWGDAFASDLLAAASQGDNQYGVPLNIHRLNSLFYDKRLFDDLGLTPPTTLAELRSLCIELKDTHGVTPLALGNQWNWTLQEVTFEMMLPAVGGPQYYVDFLAGNASATDQELVDTLNEVLWLRCGDDPANCDGYFNDDTDTVTWDVGVAKLVSGDAAMAPMGDWAKGLLESEGWVAGEDFGVVPFPGSVGTFVYTSDTFNLPAGAEHAEAARDLLTTFGSEEGQVAFNAVKGSIPARGIDLASYPEDFDEMHQQTAADWESADRVMAYSGLVPGDRFEDLGQQLKDSMQDGTIDIVTAYIEANY